MVPESVAAGHDICRQGEEADCVWILQDGEFALNVLFLPVSAIKE